MDASADTAIYRRADVYHDFYQGRGKDYSAEATLVREVVHGRNPHASSLLDVACGTGAHLRELARSFPACTGMDLSPQMLAVAGCHAPGIELVEGDMRDTRLYRRFDAVICMFSSVGYLADAGELDRAIANLAAHLEPGGVLVIEPWWSPENFVPGWVGADVVTVGGRTIARVSHTVRRGAASRMEVHYTVAAPDSGVEHFTDVHLMSLFDRETYLEAFGRAGLRAELIEQPLFAPGLLVATADGGRG